MNRIVFVLLYLSNGSVNYQLITIYKKYFLFQGTEDKGAKITRFLAWADIGTHV